MARPEESSFPIKLMAILNEECHKDIMEWLPDGSGFVILNKTRCQKEVLPLYFNLTKYSSFTRRLNRWNFIFRNKGHSKALYFHPFFTLSDPTLCLKMRPKPQKNYSRAGKKRIKNMAGKSTKPFNKKCKNHSKTIRKTVTTGATTVNANQRRIEANALPQDLSQQKSCNLNEICHAHPRVLQTSRGRYSTMIADSTYCSRDPQRVITPPLLGLKNNNASFPVVYHAGSQRATAILSDDDAPTNEDVYSFCYVPPTSYCCAPSMIAKPCSSTLNRDCIVFVQDTAHNETAGRAQHHHHFSQATAAGATGRNISSSPYCAGMLGMPRRTPPHESIHPSSSSTSPNALLAPQKPQLALGRPNLLSESTSAPPLFPSSSNMYSSQQQRLMVVSPPSAYHPRRSSYMALPAGDQYHDSGFAPHILGIPNQEDHGLIFAGGSPHGPSAAPGRGTSPSLVPDVISAPGTAGITRVMMY